jgi:hypothetical protein
MVKMRAKSIQDYVDRSMYVHEDFAKLPVIISICLSQPRELEVDPRTGMKNYIANGSDSSPQLHYVLTSSYAEIGPWDTSRALVRRTLERCIHLGRQHRAEGKKQDEHEAYRLLGQAVRTRLSTLMRLAHGYIFSIPDAHPRGLQCTLELLRTRACRAGSL